MRHPSVVWCFIGFLVTDVFSGHNEYLGLPISPDRIFFAGGVVLLLLDRRRPLRRLRWRSVHACALVVVVIAALSAFAFGTLSSSYGAFALVDRLIIPYLTFALAPLVFNHRDDRMLLMKALTLLGIYLGVTAIAELIGPHALVFPRYILDPQVGIQYGRARGPFTESEADGLTMMAACYCAMALYRVGHVRVWRRLALFGVAVTLMGSLLTLTRSIWLGMVVGLILVAIVEPGLRRLIAAGMVAAALLIPTVLLVSNTLATSATERATTSRSVYDRRNTDAAAIRAIEAHPIAGVGWSRFIDVSANYVRQSPEYPITRIDIEVHNVVLGRAAELGVPGGAIWVASVMLGPISACLRRPTSSTTRTWRMVAVGTTSAWAAAVISSPLPYPLPNTLVWLFAGLASAPWNLRVDARAHTGLAPSSDAEY